MLKFIILLGIVAAVQCSSESDSSEECTCTIPEVEETSEELLVSGVSDADLTASSQFVWQSNDFCCRAQQGRLNSVLYQDPSTGLDLLGAWVPATADTNQWIQVDFGTPFEVKGVITKGRNGCVGDTAINCEQWVESYIVQTSTDCVTFTDSTVYTGNTDTDTAVTNTFDVPVTAQCVRINPQTWNGHPSMRFDVIGCAV